MQMRLYWRQTQRLFLSASWALLLVFSAVLSASVALWTKTAGTQLAIPDWTVWAGVIAAALLLFQAYSEYQRRTYDLTLAFKFDDRFNSKEMKCLRAKAASCLERNTGNLARTDSDLADIDEVLDFFDELGFCERGGQISPEVLHQDFHYWIKGYCSAARPYIQASREKDHPRWEHVESLNEMVHAVARRRRDKSTLFSDEAAIKEFLSHEKALVS